MGFTDLVIIIQHTIRRPTFQQPTQTRGAANNAQSTAAEYRSQAVPSEKARLCSTVPRQSTKGQGRHMVSASPFTTIYNSSQPSISKLIALVPVNHY